MVVSGRGAPPKPCTFCPQLLFCFDFGGLGAGDRRTFLTTRMSKLWFGLSFSLDAMHCHFSLSMLLQWDRNTGEGVCCKSRSKSKSRHGDGEVLSRGSLVANEPRHRLHVYSPFLSARGLYTCTMAAIVNANAKSRPFITLPRLFMFPRCIRQVHLYRAIQPVEGKASSSSSSSINQHHPSQPSSDHSSFS